MQGEFTELLRRAKSGDDAAIAELHRRYAPVVGARIRQRLTPLLRRRHDTEDLAQSVFADVLCALPRVEDRGENAFRHWLLIKAENKIRDRLRRQLRRNGGRRETRLRSAVLQGLAWSGSGPPSEAVRTDDGARMRNVLASMKEVNRRALELRAQQSLPFLEVARRLGLPSADAARKRYAQALVELRTRWKIA